MWHWLLWEFLSFNPLALSLVENTFLKGVYFQRYSWFGDKIIVKGVKHLK